MQTIYDLCDVSSLHFRFKQMQKSISIAIVFSIYFIQLNIPNHEYVYLYIPQTVAVTIVCLITIVVTIVETDFLSLIIHSAVAFSFTSLLSKCLI